MAFRIIKGGSTYRLEERFRIMNKEFGREAFELFSKNNYGIIATHSLEVQGYPFSSLVAYVFTENKFESGEIYKCPVVMMSDLSQHCRNAKSNSKVSLFVQSGGNDHGSPLSESRVTWYGDLVEASGDSRDRLFELEAIQPFSSFNDFRAYAIRFTEARFYGGFGRAALLKLDDILVRG